MEDARELGCMVGWHESFLNCAQVAYDAGVILDWIDYLNQDWSQVLKLDRFPSLSKAIYNSLLVDKDALTILDKMSQNADQTNDDEVILLARRNLLGDRGLNVPDATKSVVENHILNFLRANKATLNSYFIPAVKSKK